MHRRDFIKATAGAAALLATNGRAYGYAVSPGLRKFVDPLPGIPALTPNTSRYPGVDYYEIVAGSFRQSLSSDMKRLFRQYSGTNLYGYAADAAAPAYKALGGAILANRGKPVRIKYRSALPLKHIIPFDATLAGMPGLVGQQQNRISIHLHGGLVPWASDGGPFHWVDPTGAVGVSNMNWLHDDTGTPTNDLYYPNNQSARFMWYHDHAIGTTRTTAYAGLATGYLLSDTHEAAVSGQFPRSLILVFQDKVFYNPAIDPAYGNLVGATAGDLWYPYVYEPAIWPLQRGSRGAPVPSCVPEMFGDTMLVNSCVFPTIKVDKGVYRLRTLNACNSRFLNLRFVYDNGQGEPQGGYAVPQVAPVNAWIIGTESGFLPKPVQIIIDGRRVTATAWLQAPAERSDVLVDFGQCRSNSKVILYNDAASPYPVGAPIFDWYPGAPGNPNAAAIAPGYGPNTRTLMRFEVSARTFASPNPAGLDLAEANPVLPTVPDGINGGLRLDPGVAYDPLPKEITLNEAFDSFGRLAQLIGTNVVAGRDKYGRTYLDPVTEKVTYGTIEIWNVYNLSADVHPMHFHLFNAMVLRRRLFSRFNGKPTWAGMGRGPDLGEEGWKETIKMWPGECTTIAVLIENPLPGRTVKVGAYTSTLPESLRIGGDEYVYHCHILEHEEHDMMRPIQAF